MRLIHTADVHLGATPDANMPWSQERSLAIRSSFLRIISMAEKNQADLQIEDQVLGRILAEAHAEIPEAMLKSEVNICMQQFAAELSAKGSDLGTFAKQSGKSVDQMAAEMQPLAKRRIMLRLVLSAIAEAEQLTATKEEVEAQWDAMAQQYGIDKPRLKVYAGDGAEAQIKAEITSSKAYALLRESTILEME